MTSCAPVDRAPFPHCDSSVLHAPGECETCDRYPDRQQQRVADRTNFTGHHDVGLTLCPSELARPLDVINRWPGNQPKPKPQRVTRDLDVTGLPEPPDDSRQFLLAVVVAAILTVLAAWLWTAQDDIKRQRRERLQQIPTQSPVAPTPRFPSKDEPVIAASAAEGEQ